MYSNGTVLGATTGAAVAATVLPNTGSNSVVGLALALAVGLITWGVVYSRANS